jgi:hypothetical protein
MTGSSNFFASFEGVEVLAATTRGQRRGFRELRKESVCGGNHVPQASPSGTGEAIAVESHAAIALQESAQERQTFTHSSMPPMRAQSSAHSLQISAHSLHVCL